MKQPFKRTLRFFLAFFLLATFVGARTARDGLVGYFSALSQNRQFNGNVLVAENGKIIFERSFGYGDFPDKRPNTKDTLFPLASISKTLTATAILQLVERDQLRLTDPVSKHLPGFPFSTVTIRHLLSHSSGLPPYNAFFDPEREARPDKVFTNADLIPGLLAHPRSLIYQPGANWNYDNVNYVVLALVLEKVSGTPFGVYIDRNILRPAGMRKTRLIPFSVLFDPSKKKDKHVAIPHWYPHYYSAEPIRADSMPYVSSYWHAYQLTGFGDYVSTVGDLLKYDQALSDGRLLSRRALDEAFTPVTLADGDGDPSLYGLGWAVDRDASLGKIVYHGGNAIGSSCILLRNVTKHQTVVIYDIGQDIAHAAALSALKILNGQPVPTPRKSLAKIYGQALVKEGPAAAAVILEKLKKDTGRYELNEEEFNMLGYDLMGDSNPFHMPENHRYAEALAVFQLNIELFPASWNAYDSCGEALLKTGRKEEAIRMYRKSLELNPKNENGKKVLEQLLKNDGR